jgi:hypothetical protein
LVIKALDPDWMRIRISIQPKMLEVDPDPDEMNAVLQPWLALYWLFSSGIGVKFAQSFSQWEARADT